MGDDMNPVVCGHCGRTIRAAFGQAGDADHPGWEHLHNGSYLCDDGHVMTRAVDIRRRPMADRLQALGFSLAEVEEWARGR